MIPRYSRDEMVSIWSPESKFRIWFEIEAHAASAQAKLGIVPEDAAKIVWEKGENAQFNVDRIDEIEREVKHDVIAFLTHLAEIVGPEARFVHQGMTSSDVLDTCLSVQLTRAADLLLADMDKLLAALKKNAPMSKKTPSPLAAPTASMLNRPPLVLSWHKPMLNLIGAARAWSMPAKKSPPVPFLVPSAPSPTLTRQWSNMWQRNSAWELNPFPPK